MDVAPVGLPTPIAPLSLQEKLDADLKVAIRAKDETARETIRMLKSELLKEAHPDEMAILTRAVKSRRESIAAYLEGGRKDLADKEEAEIVVIERYLPKQLDEAQAAEAIRALAAAQGITSKKDLGRLMKLVMEKHRGQIDGKLASKLAGEILS